MTYEGAAAARRAASAQGSTSRSRHRLGTPVSDRHRGAPRRARPDPGRPGGVPAWNAAPRIHGAGERKLPAMAQCGEPVGVSYPHSGSRRASAIRIRGAGGRQLPAFEQPVSASYPHSGCRRGQAPRIRGAGGRQLPAFGLPAGASSPHSRSRSREFPGPGDRTIPQVRAAPCAVRSTAVPVGDRRSKPVAPSGSGGRRACGAAARVPAEAGVPSRRRLRGCWPTYAVSRAAARSTVAPPTGTPGRRRRGARAGIPPPAAPGP